MPNIATFLISIKKIIPETDWPWVISALRQDAQIWQSLHDPEFFAKALLEFGSEPELWSPAGLSFLSLGIPIPSLATPLDQELHLQTIQSLEDLVYPQPNHPVPELPSLAKSGLVALALLENRQKSNSWSNLPSLLETGLASKYDPLLVWGTVLGVVYGLVDDRLAFLKAMIRPNAPDSNYRLALHALLSNPRKSTDHEQILFPFFQDLPIADSTRLDRLLEPSRPEMAERLARRLLNHQQSSSQKSKTVNPNAPANQLVDLLIEADLQQMAGHGEKASLFRSEALSLTRDLQADLARSLIEERLSKDDLLEIHSEWNQKVSGPTTTAPPAALIIRLLGNNAAQEVQELLTQANLHEDHPLCCLVDAHFAEQRGDLSCARQAARRCLVKLSEQLNSVNQIHFNLHRDFSPEDSLSLLDYLREFLIDLSLHNEAARAAHLAETLQPLNADLLEGESLAYRLAGEPDKAVACAHLAVALKPDDVNCRRELAASLEANEDWPAAKAERLQLMENRFAPPTEIYWPTSADWRALATCAIRANDAETAIQASQSALNIDPEDGLSQALMGDALLAQGLLAQAMEHLHLATQLTPHQPTPWLSLAQAYQSSGQTEKRIETLRAASHAVPDHPEVLFALAEAYLAEKTPTQAQPILARAHQIISSPNHPSNFARSKFKKGKQASDAQFNWNRDLPCRIAMTYGEILSQLGHANQASAVYESAYQAYPAYPGLAYAYGKALLATGEHQTALAPLIVAVGSKPRDPQPYIDYAKTLLSLQESPEAAVQALQQAIQIVDELESDLTEILEPVIDPSLTSSSNSESSPSTTRSHSVGDRESLTSSQWTCSDLQNIRNSAQAWLAEAYEASGDLTSALKGFSQALESGIASSPEWHVRLSLGMGRVALRMHQPEIAIAALQEVSRSEMNNTLVHRTLAEAYATIQLPEEALHAGQTAVQIAPDDIETLSWYANLCTHIDAHSEAVPVLTRAMQLDPKDASLAVRLGQLLLHLNEHESAHDAFVQVIGNPAASPEQLVQAGNGLTSLGDQFGAIDALERACHAKSGTSPHLLLQLASLYNHARNLPKALETIDRAVQVDNADASLHFYKSTLLARLGRQQAAQASLEHAINLEPSNPAFHLHLAILLRSEGNLTGALSHADAAVAVTQETPFHPISRIACGLAADLSRALLQPDAARRYLFNKSQINMDPFSLNEEWSQTMAAQSFTDADQAVYACVAAELALDQDEEIAAAEALTQAIEFIPSALRVQALQSRLANRRGDQPVALHTFQQALTNFENQPVGEGSLLTPPAHDLLALGITAVDLEQWETALSLLERAAAQSVHEPLPALHLARVFVLRAEYQHLCQTLDCQVHAPGVSAIDQNTYRAFQNALQLAFDRLPDDLRAAPPNMYSRWEARGNATFESSSAKLHAFDAVRETPDDDGAWLGLIAQREDLVSVNQAYSAIREKYQGAPSHPAILIQIALSKGLKGRRQEDLNDSLAAVQSAIDQRPHQPLFHAILSRLASVASNPALAQHAIMTALSFWPDEPRWHSQAACLCLDSGDTPAAISHLEKAAAYEPTYLPHYLALGQAYLQTGQPKQAIASLEQAVKVAPDQSEGHLALASAHLAMGNPNKASKCADDAINAAPDQLPPLLLRADIALQMDDPTVAQSCVERVLHLQPEHPVALHLYAQTLHQLGQTEQAMKVVEKAIPLAVDPLPLLLEQTSLLESLHGMQVNLNALQELALQYPDDPTVLAPLAKALAQNNDREAAIRTAQRALREGKHALRTRDQAGLHYLLGGLLRQTGQLDQAIHQFSEAVRLASDQLEAYLELGETQLERRQNALAIQTYQKAIQIAPEDPRPFHQAGLAFKASRDYPGAETMLRRAAELAPDDLAIHRQLAALVALNLVHSRRPIAMDA